MRHLLISAAALSLLGAGCLGKTEFAVDSGARVVTPQPPAPVPSQVQSSLTVAGELKAGADVVISSVSLSLPGYVVIHQDDNGKPAGIIGNSAYLTVGTHANVVISVKPEKDKSYWAMVHADNGNQTYSTTEDAPARETSGAVVMVRFTGAADAIMKL